MRLNLGCADDIRAGYMNVDRFIPAAHLHKKGHWSASDGCAEIDLREPWPWQDSTVDEILAHDVFEHIDNDQFRANRGKIWVMNESWRVLKPGGLLDLKVPTTKGPGAFCDPTHVSFWTFDDRYYFCEEWNHPTGERGRLGPAYGIVCRFAIENWVLKYQDPVIEESGAERRWKVIARLRAVK